MGGCLESLNQTAQAEICYRNYLELLLAGAEGSYSVEEVAQKIREVHGAPRNGGVRKEIQKAIASTVSLKD